RATHLTAGLFVKNPRDEGCQGGKLTPIIVNTKSSRIWRSRWPGKCMHVKYLEETTMANVLLIITHKIPILTGISKSDPRKGNSMRGNESEGYVEDENVQRSNRYRCSDRWRRARWVISCE